MSEFARATAVRRAEAPATYHVELDEGWQIGGGLNGGMLLATVGAALREELGPEHADPFSVTAYYLSASRPGPAALTVETLRTGRTMSTASVSLRQGTDERIRALATFGDLDGLDPGVHTTAVPPDLPAPDDCVPNGEPPPQLRGQAALLDRIDLRLDPACAGWAVGRPSNRGVIQGWLRMVDAHEPDPLLLLFAVDALPPVSFDFGLFGWAPTLELTVHVRARPAPGWLLVSHRTGNVAGGLMEEDAVVWDSAGRLVAQSRQLALVPRRRR